MRWVPWNIVFGRRVGDFVTTPQGAMPPTEQEQCERHNGLVAAAAQKPVKEVQRRIRLQNQARGDP
jgi:hypothetical protein